MTHADIQIVHASTHCGRRGSLNEMTAPSPNTITAVNLRALLAEKHDLLLLDVLPPEFFEQEHLPGARNACVYQTDFLDLAGKLIASPDQCVLVYDADRDSLASTVAAKKLVGAGYSNVLDFVGGLEEWRSAGEPVEGANADAQSSADVEKQSRTCQIDPEESLVEWTGRNIANRHYGTIRVADGQLRIETEPPRAAKSSLI